MTGQSQSLFPRLTQTERIERSDKCMFEATVNLINQRGTAGTKLKDVGMLAGYSRGLAGQRFGSKDALFSFVLRRLGEIWLAQLTRATERKTGYAAVERALDQHHQYCVDAPDQVRAFYTLWFESASTCSELSVAIRNIHDRRHADVVGWILDDPEIPVQIKQRADAIAAQFCASVIGIIYYWLANPDQLVLAETLHNGLKQTMHRLLSLS